MNPPPEFWGPLLRPAGKGLENEAIQGPLALLLAGVSEGITVHDDQRRLVYANHTAAQLLGFPDTESLLAAPLDKLLAQFQQQYELFDEQGEFFPPERLPGRRARAGEAAASEVLHLRGREKGLERWIRLRATWVTEAVSGKNYVVNIFQDITDLKRSEEDQRFLAEAGEILAEARDTGVLLESLADLAVKNIADWCAIYLIDESSGEFVQMAASNRNPALTAITREMQTKYPPNPDFKAGIYKVLKSRKAHYQSEVTEEQLQTVARDAQHLDYLRRVGLHSYIVLPLVARGSLRGYLSLVWAETKRRYEERDVHLATELARRAALALDNVRLYQQATELNAELETKVAERTEELIDTVEWLNTEIAERVEIQKDLEKSRKLFTDLFELFPDAIFLVNQQGRIMQANAQAGLLFGYETKELIGKAIEMLLPERFQARHDVHREGYQSAPALRAMGVDLELYGRRKTGEEFPVDVLLSPVMSGDEQLVISVVQDITDKLRAQAEEGEMQHRLIDSQEAQRRMLAQELHDGTIQELFSINFQMAELEQELAEKGDETLAEKARAASEMTQQVIHGLRSISRELRPPALTPFGLEQAIEGHMEHFRELHPELTVHLEVDEDGDTLDERLRLVLFRIYQNAVNNVARHAGAAQLWVRFKLKEDEISLEIEDDGQGFAMPVRWVELARQGHLGLVGIRERVEAIGGRLEILSKPQEGTCVCVKVPYPR